MTLSWAPVVSATWIVLMTLALAAALTAGLVVMRRKGIAGNWFWGLAGLRIVALILFVLCLMGPILNFTRPETRDPALLLLVDQSLATPVAPGADPRLDAELDWIRRSGLWDALQEEYNVYSFAVHGDAEPVGFDQLHGMDPYHGAARYARALRTAWNHVRFDQDTHGMEQLPPARALLLSDGHDAGPEDIVDIARRYGIPVDTMAPADVAGHEPERDAVISSVFAPGRVRLGAEARFMASLYNPDSNPVVKTLILLEDHDIALEREVTLAGQSEKPLTLSWRPTNVGMRDYTLLLTEDPNAVAEALDERSDDDEARDEIEGTLAAGSLFRFHVRVDDQRHETLLLESTWRWDFKFFRRILEDDPLFSFSAFLERGAGAFVQFSDPARRVELTGFPRTRAELEGFDIYVVGNVRPRQWPRALAPALRDLVMDEGKSLILMAGPYLSEFASVPELAELLPVEIDHASSRPRSGPIDVEVAIDGRRAPFFFSGEDPGFWNHLPPLDRLYAPLRKKPAATILVQASELSNEYGNLIVLAEHTVGRGRVLYVGTDTLWKWQMRGSRTGDGNTPYTLFWQQALRAMAAGHATPGMASVRLRSDRSRTVPGSRVMLYAEVDSESPVLQPEMTGTITLPDERSLPLMFTRSPDDADRFISEYLVEQTGRHRVAATLTSEQVVVSEALAAFDVASPELDAMERSAQLGNLQRIAAQSGGRFLERDNPRTWPTADVPERLQTVRRRNVDFWHHFLLPAVLIMVLGTDWLLRLVRGYV